MGFFTNRQLGDVGDIAAGTTVMCYLAISLD
jgi:hypothetical protein